MSSSQGILSNAECLSLYNQINERILCVRCRKQRRAYKLKDTKGNAAYSNLLLGFGSLAMQIPIDVVIVAEAHGGGSSGDFFRDQKDVESELEHLSSYYLTERMETFHQFQMRSFLKKLDAMKADWVFTDLVKCFVWQGVESNLDGRTNFDIATSHCSKYLTQQLRLLRPRVILSLGNRVSTFFGIKGARHGIVYNNAEFGNVLHSTFPSRNTADYWVKNDGWKPILKQIKSVLRKRM